MEITVKVPEEIAAQAKEYLEARTIAIKEGKKIAKEFGMEDDYSGLLESAYEKAGHSLSS